MGEEVEVVEEYKYLGVHLDNRVEWRCNWGSCLQEGTEQIVLLEEAKASRAQILDKATEYIQLMRRKNHTHQQDIDDLKKQNALLEQQVRALEKAKGNSQPQTNYSSDSSLYTNRKGSAVSAFDGGSDSTSESEPDEPPNRKKLRVETN
ncbi:hypothetical protein ATANTOWER_026195 [Ataeniobius toweri]|uniref:Uncharacterized protein n=1 Tax=Ataeniobius toweri TaxID=208326 RepID=A0ABU7B8L3_9TELE|nr:hypothetical protein [Ataeniobius toweri]